MGEKELRRLRASASAIKTRKPVKLVLFSKSGFTIQESGEVLLFDPKRMEHELEHKS